jgi:hypothetical protein
MTVIYSEATFDKQDVVNFLKTNEYKDNNFEDLFEDYGRVGYDSLMIWLNKNFTKWEVTMIMRKIECECVAHMDELHI